MQNISKAKIKVFIDADVLCIDHFSGIGHYTAMLLGAVDDLLCSPEYKNIQITLGGPWRTYHLLNRFGYKNFRIKRMSISHRVSNGLKARGLLPPIDLFFGKQIYVFPNYSSWPTIKSPSVPIIYDLSFVLHPEFSEDRNRAFLVKQALQSAKRSSKIITISKNSKAEISLHYKVDEKNIDIIYPIIKSSHFYQRSHSEINHVRAKYGIYDKYVLFVGNIEPRKNLTGLLKAYSMLNKKDLEKYALLLVGAKGWKDDEIHNQIKGLRDKGLKIIQPTGWVTDEDMPAIISGAVAFVYVSKYEGFGIPPVEAMFCGTPVITSDNSSLPEAVGRAAIQVNADNSEEIKNALARLLKDSTLRSEQIKLGLEHSKDKMFLPEVNGRKFLELIKSISKENENENE
jgi:glycosyltransferase involved in cell wall biosynthesis